MTRRDNDSGALATILLNVLQSGGRILECDTPPVLFEALEAHVKAGTLVPATSRTHAKHSIAKEVRCLRPLRGLRYGELQGSRGTVQQGLLKLAGWLRIHEQRCTECNAPVILALCRELVVQASPWPSPAAAVC